MEKNIKVKILVAMLVLLAAVSLAGYDLWSRPSAVDTGKVSGDSVAVEKMRVPDFPFMTLDGMSRKISALEEPVILLHFWASWCAPCAVEFPDLHKLIEMNEGRVALLAVSIDDEKEAMVRFMERLETRQGLETDIPHIYWIWDEDKRISRERFGAVRVPETIFIGPQRFMDTKMVGETDWLGDKVAHTIRSLAGTDGI